MSTVVDFENLSKNEQKLVRDGILLLPDEQRQAALKLPLSFAAFLYPQFVEYGPRFFLWEAGMNEIKRQLRGYDGYGMSIDLRDTYYLYTMKAGILKNYDDKRWRKNNIISQVPPRPKKNVIEARIREVADMFDGEAEVAYDALNLFSTFMLGDDFLTYYCESTARYDRYISSYNSDWNSIERLPSALDEHHEFCLRNGIDY